MKPLILCLLVASPLLVFASTEQSAAAAAVNSTTTDSASTPKAEETNLEALPESTTDITKDNALHQKKTETKKLDPTSLHRVPLYEARNPLVETINKLDSMAKKAAALQESEHTEKKDDAKANSSTTAPQLELPIPSRCPAITGTEEAEHHQHSGELKDAIIPLLGVTTKARAAQRGCRFFIMSELMDRSTVAFQHATPAEQINRTLTSCFTSCIQAYDNGTEACTACQDGCRKTAQVTEAVKKALPEGDELEREDEDGHDGGLHRSFSIIIPLRPIAAESPEDSKDTADSSMPNAIKMMLAMMHQMSERARQAMMRGADGGGSGEMAESEVNMDPSGNSISVSRSMSVLMTKDKDGHSKMVVVHTLPRVQIHRFGQSVFGSEEDDDITRRIHELTDGKDHLGLPASDDTDNDDDLMEDGDDLRVRLFGHLTNGHRGTANHQKADEHSLAEEDGSTTSSTHVYYYRSRLCYLLPRLFYLTLAILTLYLIFWICAALPAIFANRAVALVRRGSGESSVAIMATGADGKRKKLFLSKNARYFQLNSKRNSTTSLPPPYPGNEQPGDSCAEPLPEKQPLPEGGIEIKVTADK